MKYVLSQFDSDYLTAFLPLRFRRKLALRSKGFLQRVDRLFQEHQPSEDRAQFNSAKEECLRNSERIIRALIESWQDQLDQGAKLEGLSRNITISSEKLLHFLGATLYYHRRRKDDPRKPRPRPREGPPKSCNGLFFQSLHSKASRTRARHRAGEVSRRLDDSQKDKRGISDLARTEEGRGHFQGPLRCS